MGRHIKPRKIVILEMSQEKRNALRAKVLELGHVPFCFDNEISCLDNLPPLRPDLTILGSLSLEKTYRFLTASRMLDPLIPIIISSDEPLFHESIGFFDYPFCKIDKYGYLGASLGTVIGNLGKLEGRSKQDAELSSDWLVGISSEIVKIRNAIRLLIGCQAHVLVLGEPGTGKNLLAKTIHQLSDQKSRPFWELDVRNFLRFPGQLTLCMNTIKEFVLGSVGDKVLTECCGTIYLKEISEIPPALQSDLFWMAEDLSDNGKAGQEFYRFRIIASTHYYPDFLMKLGKIRKDLLFRLNTFQIEIPPLRRRKEDIGILSDYFTDKFCIEMGKCHMELSARVKKHFSEYRWPGNVTELKSCVRQIVSSGNEEIVFSMIPVPKPWLSNPMQVPDIYKFAEIRDINDYMKSAVGNDFSLKDISRKFLSRLEKKMLEYALKNARSNRKNAAELLDISYKSLLNKLKEYNISPK